MLNFKEQPYKLLLISSFAVSLLLILLPIFGIKFQNENMFLIPLVLILWTIPLFLIFFWLLYLLTKRLLYSKAITWTHIFITIATAVFILTVLYIGINPLQPTARRYYDTSVTDSQKVVSRIINISFIVLICGQSTYIVNILVGLFTKARRILNSR